MDFDPAAYIAKNSEPAKSDSGFDPAAYIAKNSGQDMPEKSTPWEDQSVGERFSNMFSDKGRQDLKDAIERQKKAQSMETAPGSRDNPHESDIFSSDADRTKSGFGDTRGVGKMLLQKGFVDFARNKDGDLVAKDAQGNWHKDASGLTHPINWAESHAGEALPLAGGVGAAALASPTGPGAILAAGAGGAGGEAARIAAGKAMGVYDGGLGDATIDTAANGAGMALGEGIGKFIIDPALRAGGSAIGNGAKNIISNLSEKTSGVPRAAVERLIERPSQVLDATPDTALDVAKGANKELMARSQSEGQAAGAGRDLFAATHGERPINTQSIIDPTAEFIGKKGGVGGEQGALAPKEVEALQNIIDTRLKGGNAPVKSGKQLQNLADYLDSQIKNFDQSKLPGTGDTPYQSQLRRLYGQVKAALHDIDPEGLGASDAKFHAFANDAGELGNLEDPSRMEAFVNNYFGKNKSMMRQAAERVLPESTPAIEDLGANKAFSNATGPSGSHAGLRNGASLVLGTGGAAEYHDHPLVGGGMMAAGALLQPRVQMQLIGQSAKALESPLVQAVLKNPRLIQMISNPALKAQVEAAVGGASKLAGTSSEDSNRRDQAHYDPGLERAAPMEDAKQRFLEGN